MKTKTNVNISLGSLLKKIDDDFLSKNNNEQLDEMLSSFVNKYNFIEHYLEDIVIKLVINTKENISRDFNFKDILYVYAIQNLILLKKILAMYTKKYENKEVTVCFIVDTKANVDMHKIEDYALCATRYESNKENNHKQFENSFKKNLSYYAKNAKKSMINTLYLNNQKKVFRQNNKNVLTEIESIKDTINNKYINVNCPICASEFAKLPEIEKEKFKLHTFKITEDSIDEIIHVEKNTKRISFNCLHEQMKIETSKFYIETEKYDVDLDKENKRKVQIWFLKNLKYIIESRLNEIS